MDTKKEFIKKAIDSNAFISSSTEAGKVNPNIWDYKIRDYEEANLIVTPLAEQFDFRGAGVDYKVTIDEAPSASSALTETVDITVSTISTRSVTFTPAEYGSRYQLTRKEAVRSFFNVADRMSKKLGYSLYLKKDAMAVAVLQAATTSLLANSKTVATDLASTDTMNYALITKGIATMEGKYYTPSKLLINYTQKNQLLDLQSVNNANLFGTRTALEKGLLGELFGVQIYVSHSIGTSNNVAKAILLGQSRTGEQAFGYAIKRDPIVETQYFAAGRYWDIVAHEEYDFKILHQGAVVLLSTYA